MALKPNKDDGKGERQQNLDLLSFKISYNVGFMLENPLKALPIYFNPWNMLAEKIPELYKAKKVREAVHELPLLDYAQLAGYRELRLAHLQLSIITAGYVWQEGDAGTPKSLPKCLAVPFYHISNLLGIQPVLCHADLALANWRLIDPNGPFDFENLQCICHIPGDFAGDWFCIAPFMVEFTFAKCLKNLIEIVNLLNFAQQSDSRECTTTENLIAAQLDEVTSVIKLMKQSLSRIHDHLDAKIFFNEVRPFLAGWGGEGNPMPEGLIYEGISTTPLKMSGGSAAQSSTVQVLDALLGVQHKTGQRDFLVQMRRSMPPEHKRFIEYIENSQNSQYSLRHLVESTKNALLLSSYNNCIAALVQFRTYHIQVVSKYVLAVSKEMNEGNFKSLDTKGTGGTSLIPFLKDLRADTEVKTLIIKEGEKHSQVSWLTFGAFAIIGVSVMYGALKLIKRQS